MYTEMNLTDGVSFLTRMRDGFVQELRLPFERRRAWHETKLEGKKQCPKCDHWVPDTANFCKTCYRAPNRWLFPVSIVLFVLAGIGTACEGPATWCNVLHWAPALVPIPFAVTMLYIVSGPIWFSMAMPRDGSVVKVAGILASNFVGFVATSHTMLYCGLLVAIYMGFFEESMAVIALAMVVVEGLDLSVRDGRIGRPGSFWVLVLLIGGAMSKLCVPAFSISAAFLWIACRAVINRKAAPREISHENLGPISVMVSAGAGFIFEFMRQFWRILTEDLRFAIALLRRTALSVGGLGLTASATMMIPMLLSEHRGALDAATSRLVLALAAQCVVGVVLVGLAYLPAREFGLTAFRDSVISAGLAAPLFLSCMISILLTTYGLKSWIELPFQAAIGPLTVGAAWVTGALVGAGAIQVWHQRQKQRKQSMAENSAAQQEDSGDLPVQDLPVLRLGHTNVLNWARRTGNEVDGNAGGNSSL